jgi:hypothetical protein
MVVERPCRQVGDLDAGAVDPRRALDIRKTNDCIRVGHIKIVADQRHAEWRIQILQKRRP